MSINLGEIIGTNLSVTLVIPNEQYVNDIKDIAQQLSVSYTQICYVSLNKLYQPLVRGLQQQQIDISRFFFIDAITKTAIANAPETENAVFVTSPSSLTELGITIKKVIDEHKIQVLLFDSLSTLLVYEEIQVIKQFIHTVIGQISMTNCVGIFTCLEGEKEKDLLKDLSMFVDSVHYVTG